MRKLWSEAKVRRFTHFPTEAGRDSISLKLQSNSSRAVSLYNNRKITVTDNCRGITGIHDHMRAHTHSSHLKKDAALR